MPTLHSQDGDEQTGSDEKEEEDGEKTGSGKGGKDDDREKTCALSTVCVYDCMHSCISITIH